MPLLSWTKPEARHLHGVMRDRTKVRFREFSGHRTGAIFSLCRWRNNLNFLASREANKSRWGKHRGKQNAVSANSRWGQRASQLPPRCTGGKCGVATPVAVVAGRGCPLSTPPQGCRYVANDAHGSRFATERSHNKKLLRLLALAKSHRRLVIWYQQS